MTLSEPAAGHRTPPGPLLSLPLVQRMRQAASEGLALLRCSLDLGRSECQVQVGADAWSCGGQRYPYPQPCRERTLYYWSGTAFEPAARYEGCLFKLVPTDWGPPIFEIDGIKMLPSAQLSPLEDARAKVALIEPRGKRILDCCGGLGYFAACCLEAGCREVLSFEKQAAVLWLRSLNPWSPGADERLRLHHADVIAQLGALGGGAVDAILHDPPRFGIAGELYSQQFYDELARVLRRGGKLFHYTGSPNKLTSGRNVAREVAVRLQRAGFRAAPHGDGVLATRA